MFDSIIWVGSVGLILTVIAVVLFMKSQQVDYSTEVDNLLSSALIMKQKGETSQAQVLLEQALSHLRDSSNPDTARMASCLIHLAECYERQQQMKEAKDCRDKLIALWRQALAVPTPATFIDIDYALSTNEFGSGLHQITEFYERVVEQKEQMFGQTNKDVANSLLIYARLLRKLGEKEVADAAEARAHEIHEKIRLLEDAQKKAP